MTLVRNISSGPRGVWAGGVLVMVERGKTVEADDFAPEWFEPVKAGPLDHDGDGEPGGSLAGEESTVAKGRRKKAEPDDAE